MFSKGFFLRVVKNCDCVVKRYSLPNDIILDLSKLKAFADEKILVNEKLQFFWGRTENIVRKGENAGYQHFLLFPQCLKKASFLAIVINQCPASVHVTVHP